MTTTRLTAFALVLLAALAGAGTASAHAHLSPPVALAGAGQVFTLAVPTEKSGVTTTSVELTPPAGFAIDSFLPSPGWHRVVRQAGSGEAATVTKVTWSGGAVPTGEDAAFSFLAEPGAAHDYTFQVRQTYSDGTIVDWSGPGSSDTPAPVLASVSSLGGGGGTSTLTIVALAAAALALVLAVAGLALRGDRAVA